MRLVLADSSYLKDSVSVISELVSEARFKVTKDGLEMIAMDPANVAMVVFKLLSSAFAEFDVKETSEVAINLANFKQILKRATPSDVLSLEVTKDNKLQVQLKSGNTRTFALPLIELEEKEQRIPSLSFPVHITMPSSVLDGAINDADIVAESVSFVADPEGFQVVAEGDLSKAHVDIKPGTDTTITSDTKAKVKAKYSVEYLKKMTQGGKLADNVSISFNQDYPLKMEYKVIDRLMLSFILAPRVEND